MPPTPWAVIAGVGPGTGAALARKFAASYPVALLARNPDNYTSLADEINKSGGKAIGISTDVADASSVKAAFSKIEKEYGSACAAAVFNASGKFFRKSVLELTEEEFTAGYDVSCKGAFLFTQSALPYLLKVAEDNNAKYPPTIIYTGATASVKSNALMSSFSTGKYAMRALVQSVAREFAPKGVHVAHAIIDGVIDIPRTKDWLKDMPPEAKISAQGIADAYWNLHTQPKTTFTNEIDIRPMLEKW
ncbi:NAD(P)-binding protein [Myriangium duriaei CBS 260.36]|uniref:NAD(P)-binding protein n=1 Tax=Myriangium duriaei CBS 260.36 TaxID=1168546 RepID=A0A9P4MFE8_9PEZI|nr:NAD(P)-binding protein [Myriangium duriaei CBS 260.36]